MASRIAVPDTSLSVPLDRWPNDFDLQKLEKLKGKSPADVIGAIGHPIRVEKMENGVVRWRYDWLAACHISIKNDTVESSFYTAGF